VEFPTFPEFLEIMLHYWDLHQVSHVGPSNLAWECLNSSPQIYKSVGCFEGFDRAHLKGAGMGLLLPCLNSSHSDQSCIAVVKCLFWSSVHSTVTLLESAIRPAGDRQNCHDLSSAPAEECRMKTCSEMP